MASWRTGTDIEFPIWWPLAVLGVPASLHGMSPVWKPCNRAISAHVIRLCSCVAEMPLKKLRATCQIMTVPKARMLTVVGGLTANSTKNQKLRQVLWWASMLSESSEMLSKLKHSQWWPYWISERPQCRSRTRCPRGHVHGSVGSQSPISNCEVQCGFLSHEWTWQKQNNHWLDLVRPFHCRMMESNL